ALAEEDVALLGLGSIGTGVLSLLLKRLPHPRRLRLYELPARREHLLRLRDELLPQLGFRGDLEVATLPTGECPDAGYDASLILSATSAPNLLDVARLRPGTLLVDDSAPHCFDPQRALRRFQQQRDVLFTEAGALRSHRTITEISDLNFSSGWDDKVRA